MEKIPCRHEITGHECDFPEDALPAWRALGWKPISEYPAPQPESDSRPSEDAATPAPPPKPAARHRGNEPKE